MFEFIPELELALTKYIRSLDKMEHKADQIPYMVNTLSLEKASCVRKREFIREHFSQRLARLKELSVEYVQFGLVCT